MSKPQIEEVDIASLTLDDNNARVHSQRNIDSIKNSLQTFGLRKPVVVSDNVVIAGNGTVIAAKELGWKRILVARTPADWSDEMRAAYALADNRTAELATWDEEVLLGTLTALDESLIEAAGFTEMDIRALTAIYGEIPEGYEGRTSEPDTSLKGKVISIKVSDDTYDRWNDLWKTFDGDDDVRLNEIMDTLP